MTQLLDCTLRDGGYYNDWDFDQDLVLAYLSAMEALGVDVVELGFRSPRGAHFKGPYAYTTDELLLALPLPDRCEIAVMVNGADLLRAQSIAKAIDDLFPVPRDQSPVGIVRVACHAVEFVPCLPAARMLVDRGYRVGFNVMQIADLPATSIASLAEAASASAIDILYFADSMGSLTPERTRAVVDYFRQGWQGDLGIHTHDNLGLALANTLAAADAGVEWVDSTVTGMGRGPGNVKTEDLAVEWIERRAGRPGSVIPLLGVIDNYFAPLQKTYGWGKNPYYYLAGRYGIHPTYVQAMIDDSRYGPEDILAAIEHLRVEGGKRFCADTLDSTRQFYQGPARGSWEPADAIRRREVLIVGAGPSVHRHQAAIERFIEKHEPYVIALNTDSAIAPNLIDARIACHPIRLLADCRAHVDFPQPLITPASMLPSDVRESLEGKQLYDYGLSVEPGTFSFSGTSCTVPSTLVAAYALAVATGGSARRIWLAGFDGYGPEDRRTVEMQRTVSLYESCSGALSLTSLTPTSYSIPVTSVYAL